MRRETDSPLPSPSGRYPLRHRPTRTVPDPPPPTAGGIGRYGRVWSRLMRAARQIFGAPDFEAYLQHCRRVGHPPRLSEEEFVRDFFERKGKVVRCC